MGCKALNAANSWCYWQVWLAPQTAQDEDKHGARTLRTASQGSRNAQRVQPWVWPEVAFCLGLDWSPEQIANKLPLSHESVYLHVYADKAKGGKLHKALRSQKPRRKRHLRGQDRRGHIPDRRPISQRPAHIEGRKQVGHWEGDTVIGAGHSQAVVTLVERKSGYARIISLGHEAQSTRLVIRPRAAAKVPKAPVAR